MYFEGGAQLSLKNVPRDGYKNEITSSFFYVSFKLASLRLYNFLEVLRALS